MISCICVMILHCSYDFIHATSTEQNHASSTVMTACSPHPRPPSQTCKWWVGIKKPFVHAPLFIAPNFGPQTGRGAVLIPIGGKQAAAVSPAYCPKQWHEPAR